METSSREKLWIEICRPIDEQLLDTKVVITFRPLLLYTQRILVEKKQLMYEFSWKKNVTIAVVQEYCWPQRPYVIIHNLGSSWTVVKMLHSILQIRFAHCRPILWWQSRNDTFQRKLILRLKILVKWYPHLFFAPMKSIVLLWKSMERARKFQRIFVQPYEHFYFVGLQQQNEKRQIPRWGRFHPEKNWQNALEKSGNFTWKHRQTRS